MNCDSVRKQLTAYLDGELGDDRGSAVRGHLRGCEACRRAAGDEAALRDGLRMLPPVDPPASLWAGVQAKLAAAEVADAERPAWRRALARWAPKAPTIGFAGAAIAAAALLIVLKFQRADEPQKVTGTPIKIAPTEVRPDQNIQTPAPERAPLVDDNVDVTEAVAAAPARQTADYADASAELLELATEARAQWSDERKAEFDTQLAALQGELAAAKDERGRQKAHRAIIRFAQRAVIRDDVALASAGAP